MPFFGGAGPEPALQKCSVTVNGKRYYVPPDVPYADSAIGFPLSKVSDTFSIFFYGSMMLVFATILLFSYIQNSGFNSGNKVTLIIVGVLSLLPLYKLIYDFKDIGRGIPDSWSDKCTP